MGGGTRDTGFMLEWMLFAERLQEDCTICYFLKTAGEKNEHAESLRTETEYRASQCLCVCMRVTVCVFALFVYSHVCWSVYIHVFPVSWDVQSNIYLLCDV